LTNDAGPSRLSLTKASFAELSGWADADVTATLPAFLKSCARFADSPAQAAFGPLNSGVDYGRVADWLPLCKEAAAIPAGDAAAARRFFEDAFAPMRVADYGDSEGLFTGYFEIELRGSRYRHGPFQTPIYQRPRELGLGPPYSRAKIEDGALAGHGLELFWVDDPIDAFFLQIQGSGRIRLDDGDIVRVGYDGQNGLPYVSVGRLLLERNEIPRDKLTMTSIREWMRAHPQAGAALRREDPSFIFFRVVRGDGPIGAERVALTPEHSLAVDRNYIPLGAPIWLTADERFLPNMQVRRLAIAQDTGGAIKGPVRGDVFWGAGSVAGERAGQMNARGHYYLLLPRAVADRLASEEARR